MPNINVLNEVQIKQNGITTTYRVGTVNGYYNPLNGKFYLESTHVTEIGGAPNLVYADIAGNALYIYKTATSSFVKVSGEGGSGGLVYGYYNETDDKFYEDEEYTTEISGDNEKLFITLDTNYIYRYDSTEAEFIQIGGSGDASDAIVYVDTLPTPPDIKNVIYGAIIRTAYTETVADNFLDENDLFIKTEDPLTGGYSYTAAEGVTLEASEDDTEYKDFNSLSYDGISDWTLTFEDGNFVTLADGDDFYFKYVQKLFYAGNEEEQTLVSFSTGGSGGGNEYFAGEGIVINNNVISVIPATNADIGGVKPDNNTIKIDVNGVLSGNYEGGYGIKVEGRAVSAKTFIGTQAEWDNLTSAQKAKFDTVSITDDFSTLNNTPGHIVIDTVGNEMPQRTKLKFADAVVTDDSTNDMSIVTHVPYTAGNKIDITNNEIGCDDTVKGTFIGTTAEWNALNTTDKAKYDIVNLTDDAATTTAVVDVLQDGNMNAVTSNAVYDAIHNTDFTIDTLALEDGATTVVEVDKTVNSLSQYKFILISIIVNSSDDRVNTVMIPTELFRLVPSYYSSAYQGVLVGAAKYIDDTHIKVKCYNQSNGYGKMYVAGVK